MSQFNAPDEEFEGDQTPLLSTLRPVDLYSAMDTLPTSLDGLELPMRGRVSSINNLSQVASAPAAHAPRPAVDTTLVDAELEALLAIYPDEEDSGFSVSIAELPAVMRNLYKRVQVNINKEASAVMVLPIAYPAVSPVVMKTTYSWLTDALEGFLVKHFHPGSEVLLDAIQFLRDTRGRGTQINTIPHVRSASASAGAGAIGDGDGDGDGNETDDAECGEEADDLPVVPDSVFGDLLSGSSSSSSGSGSSSSSRGQNSAIPASVSNSASKIEVTHGQPMIEKKSVFIAHMAQVNTLADVQAFRAEVLSDKKVARATHNIFAFRFTDAASGVTHHDCDDDGETAAGSRVGEMLRLMGLGSAGNAGAAVIVSRWYGGIKLGPDRFKFINNSARGVLEQCGLVISGAANANNSAAHGGKKGKGG